MYRFFIDPSQTIEDIIQISGEDYRHIHNVLRLRIGEHITISDGQIHEYECEVDKYDEENAIVFARIVDVLGQSAELPVQITLFQGIPKADKMEFIIQKAVELGVTRIVPVVTKRTIVKLDEKKELKRNERYNAIALSAAKQSKRSVIPRVEHVVTFQQALSMANFLAMNLIPYEDAKGMEHSRKIVSEIKGKESLGIFIGPEGGFELKEVEAAMKIGAECITLGKRILRTETAGMTMLSIVMFMIEEE